MEASYLRLFCFTTKEHQALLLVRTMFLGIVLSYVTSSGYCHIHILIDHEWRKHREEYREASLQPSYKIWNSRILPFHLHRSYFEILNYWCNFIRRFLKGNDRKHIFPCPLQVHRTAKTARNGKN
jgi:hypothetical protein